MQLTIIKNANKDPKGKDAENIKSFWKRKKNKRRQKCLERFQNFTEEEEEKKFQYHPEHHNNISEEQKQKVVVCKRKCYVTQNK